MEQIIMRNSPSVWAFLLLSVLFILSLTLGLTATYGLAPDSIFKLQNRCQDQNKITASENQPSILAETAKDISITNPHYGFAFRFPSTNWKIQEALVSQSEEAIRFPKVLYSLHLSYPSPNGRSTLVVFTVSPDYCVATEEWISKVPNEAKFAKESRTYDNGKWLVASAKEQHGVEQIAMMHAGGFHYEFHLFMQDENDALFNSQLLDQLLVSFRLMTKP